MRFLASVYGPNACKHVPHVAMWQCGNGATCQSRESEKNSQPDMEIQRRKDMAPSCVKTLSPLSLKILLLNLPFFVTVYGPP